MSPYGHTGLLVFLQFDTRRLAQVCVNLLISINNREAGINMTIGWAPMHIANSCKQCVLKINIVCNRQFIK